MISTRECDLAHLGDAERSAARALRDCDVDRCVRIAETTASVRLRLIAAYGLLLVYRSAEARSVLAGIQAGGVTDPRDAVALDMLKTWATIGTSISACEAACPPLAARAHALGDVRLCAEIELLHAEIAHVGARQEQACERVERILGRAQDPIVILRARKLQADIDTIVGDHQRALERLIENLTLIETLSERHVWYEGMTLRGLISLALNLDRLDVVGRVAERAQSLRWASHYPLYWKAIIHGAVARAYWLHRGPAAAVVHIERFVDGAAIDSPLQIHALTEAAELSKALENSGPDLQLRSGLQTSDAISRGTALAEGLDWRGVSEDDQPFILDLAALVVPRDRARGLALVQRFRDVRLDRGGFAKWRAYEPLRLHERAATGRIELGLGRRMIATAKLAETVSAYERIGFLWRSADAAIALAETTGSPVDAQAVVPYAHRWPNSWIAARHAALFSPTRRLPSAA